jgi:hypothetical protein
MATQEQVTISRPAPYLEAAGQTYLDLLTAKTGQAPTTATNDSNVSTSRWTECIITSSTTTSSNTSWTWCINI